MMIMQDCTHLQLIELIWMMMMQDGPPSIDWIDLDDDDATSESMLLIVGLIKSVMVTVISGMKNNCNRKVSSFFPLVLDKNLVFVWKVLQGVAQGDASSPVKILLQCSPENMQN